MTKIIPLTKGKVAIVDDEDFEWLSKFKWCFDCGYAARRTTKKEGMKLVYMHRYMSNVPNDMEIDHINGDKLDNRRENLRICTHSENVLNQPIHKNSKTGKKGVFKHQGKFVAAIRINNKKIYIGIYSTVDEASKAYDEAAKKYHGEFARLNGDIKNG